ncbi:MAG: hypothetical protein J07HX64_02515 [halophilic archaeon J07HX64]|jgi:hypothetical protein|nr:MAG: hypothetical protein J07HX64_02515 [halophilic archaeon J07HX64]
MVTVSWVLAGIVLAGLNVLLLGTAGFVWVSNYRKFRTSLLLGLVGFAAVMLVENFMTIYSFVEWGRLYADSTFAKRFFTGLRGIQFLALASLNYVTWK